MQTTLPRHRPFQALIFDVDGTLVDTEREGHLPACNAAFRALGLPVAWTWEGFKEMLHVPGNGPRLRLWLARHTDMPEAEIEDAVAHFVALKQRIYIETYLPALPLRPGVAELIAAALDEDLRLAVVSTSHEAQIHALLKTRLPEAYPHFDPILGRESGPKTGPDGRLYMDCLAQMQLTPADALVIEDSAVGVQAARRAGLPCAAIYNDITFGQPFEGAVLVANSLACITLDQLLCLCAPQ